MKLRIENVGIIRSATINLNGLTVITGPNNSGKTTIGKTLFSLITAMENLTALAFEDKRNYALRRILLEFEELGIRYLGPYYTSNDEIIYSKKNPFQQIILNIKEAENIEDIVSSINKFISSISTIDSDYIREALSKNTPISSRISKRFLEEREMSIVRLNKLIKTLKLDPELDTYSNTKIIKYLNKEFNDQITPVKLHDAKPSIRLYDENISYFNIQSLENTSERYCRVSPFEKCFLIDDINILNRLNQVQAVTKARMRISTYEDEISQTISGSIFSHGTHLANAMLKNISIYEENIFENETRTILEEISKEFSSTILYKNKDFICDNDGLNIKNLASGTKLFAIIKTLIQKGAINEKTILVLDEPENHLHPEWQNRLAEIIVLLAKLVGTKVVITTHSPTFLLALETMTKQNQMEKKLSAYLSEKCEDNYMVTFKDVTTNLNKAYEHLNLPYISMNTLYEELSNDCEE